MSVQLIGKNLKSFKESISKCKYQYSIQNYWTFQYDSDLDAKTQIDSYFVKLKEIKKSEGEVINLKEFLLVKIKNIFDPEITLIT